MESSSGLNPFTDFCFLFLSIVIEGAPFIFIGTLISGFIDAYLPPGLIDRWLPKNKHRAVMVSALLGAVFPVCECAVVPVIRRLIRKGLPVSCAITYMLAAPIINPITVISTFNAFNIKAAEYGPGFFAASRLAIAFIVTVGVGWVVLKMRPSSVLQPKLLDDLTPDPDFPEPAPDAAAEDAHPHEHHKDEEEKGEHQHDHDHDHGHGHDHDHGEEEEKPDRLILAMRSAMRDFVDVAMYFTIGVAITALFRAYVTENIVLIFQQSEFVSVNLMMALAFILSLCSTSDAFIAANFPATHAAKLAFLVFGPMMDVKLVFMYLAVFRRKFVSGLAVSLFVVIGVLCYLWMNIA